jgi:hypothetical protein
MLGKIAASISLAGVILNPLLPLASCLKNRGLMDEGFVVHQTVGRSCRKKRLLSFISVIRNQLGSGASNRDRS